MLIKLTWIDLKELSVPVDSLFSGCKLDVVLDFDGINAKANAWIDIPNHSLQKDGKAMFAIDDYVRIPHYSENERLAQMFTIITVFKETATGTLSSKTLASTCASINKERKPTLAVNFLPGGILQFLVDPADNAKHIKTDTISIELKYSVLNYFVILLFFSILNNKF